MKCKKKQMNKNSFHYYATDAVEYRMRYKSRRHIHTFICLVQVWEEVTIGTTDRILHKRDSIWGKQEGQKCRNVPNEINPTQTFILNWWTRRECCRRSVYIQGVIFWKLWSGVPGAGCWNANIVYIQNTRHDTRLMFTELIFPFAIFVFLLPCLMHSMVARWF